MKSEPDSRRLRFPVGISLRSRGRPRFLLLMPLLLLLTLPAVVQAQFDYTIDNGTISITGYYGSGGAVTIPETINGLPVTSIGGQAFNNQTNLTSVTIGNRVTYIGYLAFVQCYNLTSVTIGNSVTYIGYAAFNLCRGLTNITIPDSVTSIGDDAFHSCSFLTSVTLGNSVTNIGSYAFHSCGRLTSITIPNNVTSIGEDTFGACRNLTAITVGAANSAYSGVDGSLFDKSQTRLIQCPAGKAGSYTVPNSVTNIGNYAFAYCASLVNVTISDSVTSIGRWAFYVCTSLRGVYFKGNAPSGDSSVFAGANNAISYYLPGTTGWGPTFGGRPTALWLLPNPVILNTGPSFGVRTNAFGFILSWATNLSMVVEACTSLANPAWSPLGTNTLIGGWSYFSDSDWTNHSGRFYRVRSQ